MNTAPRIPDTSFHLRRHPLLVAAFLYAALVAMQANAFIAVQSPNAPYVSFEAEAANRIIAGTPTSWAVTNVVGASGGRSLYAAGTASPGTSPHSFAIYRIKFTRPGTYYFYWLWKADAAYTAGDRFTANSSQVAQEFGELTTPGDTTGFAASSSNGTEAPANNTFEWRLDGNAAGYEVTAEMVASGIPVSFTIGTREAGMVIDRIVFHMDNALPPARLDELPADSDIVTQGSADTYLAWEADVKARIIPGTPTSWASTNVPNANGGTALYATGTASPGTSPHSFALYQLKFSRAGTYYFYWRWKADAAYTAGDRFTANSSQVAQDFGELTTPGDTTGFAASASNGTEAPANNEFAWLLDGNTAGYTVTAEMIAAGTPLILSLGTREAGMVVDRIVLHPDNTLSTGALDGLINSGEAPAAPEVSKATGTEGLNGATIAFTRALNPSTVNASRFVIGGLTVTSAAVDANDTRRVHLTTSAQTQGTTYTVTINGITDTAGTPIAANTTTTFTAWKTVQGWVRKDVYFNVTGSTIDALRAAPNFPGAPDRVEYIRGFTSYNDPNVGNHGQRLSAFFTPGASGNHAFYMANDDEAELLLSDTGNEADLQSLGILPISATGQVFDDQGQLPAMALTAGRRYLLTALVQSGGGDVYLHVGVRPPGSQAPAADVPILGGSQVSVLVDPSLGVVNFKQQPANTSVPAGTRAKFTVTAETDVRPVYFQWRVNGQDIPGANRSVYVTPTLTEADSGKSYSVVVSVAGTDNVSANATLTVTPGSGSSEVPYLGINFVGGGGLASGVLANNDVAGVVFQENWNNITGFTADSAALVDDRGVATPVTLSFQGTQAWYSGGAATGDADGTLLEGYVNFNNAEEPLVFTLANVPTGKYSVIVYSVGFQFNATYEQAYSIAASTVLPEYRGKAYTGLDYNGNPGYRRMSSTNPDQRDHGNFVRWDDVSPAGDGTLTISVLSETLNPGNGHLPAVNAIQLVKIVPVAVRPSLTATRQGANNVVVSWPAEGNFQLQSREQLASGIWVNVPGQPVLSGGRYSVTEAVSGVSKFYRLLGQ